MIKIRLVFLATLMTLVSGSQCLDPDRLYLYAKSSQNPLSMLYQAAAQQHVLATEAFTRAAVESKIPHWMTRISRFIGPEQLRALAASSESRTAKRVLLEPAAKAGHAPSQFDLALASQSKQDSQLWLQRSAEQHYQPAVAAVYQAAKSSENHRNMRKWMSHAAKTDVETLLDYADFLWFKEGTEAAKDVLMTSKFAQTPRVKSLLEHIKHSSAKDQNLAISQEKQCTLRLQIVSDNIKSIEQAQEISLSLQQDLRFKHFPICLNPPVWYGANELQCSGDANKRLTCNLAPLAQLAERLDFTHILVISRAGVANVHNGLMYLDNQDDYLVFLHEFAHFAGFVDEYPLSGELADNICQRQMAPNVVFTNKRPELKQTQFARFSKDNKNVKLVEARTCLNTDRLAYKPLDEITFMEHHDVGGIPELYLQIWRESLDNKANLTPVYVNFAQWYEKLGQPQLADKWWHKYHEFK